MDFIKEVTDSINSKNKVIKIYVGSAVGILELKELINEFEDKFSVKALDDFYLEENKTYPKYSWYRKFDKKRKRLWSSK